MTPPLRRSTKKKGNGLAITALVLASLFFLPIIPFIGLVLGIVALATGRSKPMSIVAICLGAFFTLMTGIYAAIAIPAFMKYIRRSKADRGDARTRASSPTPSSPSPPLEAWAKLVESDWTPAGERLRAARTIVTPSIPASCAGEPWTIARLPASTGPQLLSVPHPPRSRRLRASKRVAISTATAIFGHFQRARSTADGRRPASTTENELE